MPNSRAGWEVSACNRRLKKGVFEPSVQGAVKENPACLRARLGSTLIRLACDFCPGVAEWLSWN
jgi:hypothetical protein